MNEQEAFEKWYKDNVKMLDHTPLTYSIAISAWKEAQAQVLSEIFDKIDADITWG